MTGPVDYILMDPTANVTILVTTPVPVPEQPETASRLMRAEPSAEQVGFLMKDSGADVALRMAGGEFCGNAAMSAAVLRALQSGAARGDYSVRVSGTPVRASVASLPDGLWRGTVDMPRPLSVGAEPLPGGGMLPVIRFGGITHVVLEHDMDRAQAEALAPVWCRRLGAPALGLMFLHRAEGTLTPLVYVPAADTLFWENSCASGTSAAGAYLARETGAPVRLRLRQPGGTLEIAADPGGALSLTGTVRVLRRGELA